MLYLTKEDMCKVFSMSDAFEALHDAFTLYSSGKSTVPLRSMIDVPHHRGQAIFMPALAGDALGIKIVSTYPGTPVPPACMLVMDASTGEACCLMDGTYLTPLRTAAGAGLATEVLAAPGARVGALIGLGGQAPCQFDAMLEAAPTLREVRVFDIDENRRAAFAAQRDGAGGVRVVAAQSADEAVRGANIVSTVTTSSKPVFSADSIQ